MNTNVRRPVVVCSHIADAGERPHIVQNFGPPVLKDIYISDDFGKLIKWISKDQQCKEEAGMNGLDKGLAKRLEGNPIYDTLTKNIPEDKQRTINFHSLPERFYNKPRLKEIVASVMCDSRDEWNAMGINKIFRELQPHIGLTFGEGGNITALHLDGMCIPCLVSLHKGEKTWRLWKPASVIDMVKGQRVPRQTTPDVTVTQRAGDTLYLPPGWWHEVVTNTPGALYSAVYLPVEHMGVLMKVMFEVMQSFILLTNTDAEREVAAVTLCHKEYFRELKRVGINPTKEETERRLCTHTLCEEAYKTVQYTPRHKLRQTYIGEGKAARSVLLQKDHDASNTNGIIGHGRDIIGRRARKKKNFSTQKGARRKAGEAKAEKAKAKAKKAKAI